MNKLSISSLLLLFFLIVSGCKKDDSSDNTPGLSVNINGTAWVAKITTATYQSQSNILLIMGTNSTATEGIELGLIAGDVGTYNFSDGDADAFGAYYAGVGDDYTSFLEDNPVGQIVITEFDKTNLTISGTFHFEAYNDKNVKKSCTDGKFNKIKYLTQ